MHVRQVVAVAKKGYVLFQLERLGLAYSLLYPVGWQVKEITDERYAEVYIVGPRSRAGHLTVSFRVFFSSESQQTVEEVASSFLREYSSTFSIQVLGQAFGKVSGFPASEAEVTFSIPLPPDSLSPRMTVICERRVFLKREDNLFEFLYRAPEEDYWTWLEAFRVLVQTFSVLEESQKTTFHPFIADTTVDATKGSDEKEVGEES